jgi:gamma-glutamyltranspeptidase/glutathione hydrolase
MRRFTISRWKLLTAVAAALVVLLGWASDVGAAHQRAARGRGGAVACAATDARDAGLEILAAGGNAVDAAVATALALAVVYPQAGNLGGGGFAVLRLGRTVEALDFRETAPAAATRKMYLDDSGEVVPSRSLVGPLAAGVPGSPAGLFELHQRHGRLGWPRVVGPAIRLAEDGFVVSQELHEALVEHQELLARFPETAEVWLPAGQPPKAGTTKHLPELAATLKRYAEDGPSAILEGAAAAAVETVSNRHGGVLQARDLGSYRALWREPIRFRAFGWEVASMPLPSSGGIILAQTCALLERLGWPGSPRFGADRVHLLAETWRRAYADRFLLGDPRTTRANAAHLLAPAWLDHRARQINRRRAMPSDSVRPWSRSSSRESSETTHLSVVDGSGNMVSLTTTLNGIFGCGLVVPGLGFLLNNEMDDFAAAPGRPNQFGLIQGEANAVAPGLRMLSSMTPTVAWRGLESVALGSPGGSRIPTATAQVLLNLVVDGDHLQAAVNRPRVHHQWLPDTLYVEADTLAPETEEKLAEKGHVVQQRAAIGKVHAVRRLASGEVEAAADPRGPGAAGVLLGTVPAS